MNHFRVFAKPSRAVLVAFFFCVATANVLAADKELLDILLENGAINQTQYQKLIQKKSLKSDDFFNTGAVTETNINQTIDEKIDAAVAEQIAVESPIKASHGSKGFRLETRDGKWQTNLQWRAQFRFTNPSSGDPRQLSSFDDASQSTFEARRLRMKIGGHGYQPWLKYYFEVDLQPSRDVDDSSSAASARVIDWRIDVAKWDWGGIRVGQWKIDYNRERSDSSGRQQFVERSIVNRVFTIDRQVGIQLRGHAFKNTPADIKYYLGAFTGEGRGVRNTDNNLLLAGRIQWNFLGRDLPLRQTDVEFTESPTGSFAIAASTTRGSCTRWSSSGCGNLDGFAKAADAEVGQFEIEQAVQEFAFKYRGFSVQQELHRKTVKDRVAGEEYDLTGGYIQSGYFFHHMFPSFPEPLELAVRYAFVEEPNAGAGPDGDLADPNIDNDREELTVGANWFFNGHNNKLTLDYSHLTLDDNMMNRDESENRVRLQWDVSF